MPEPGSSQAHPGSWGPRCPLRTVLTHGKGSEAGQHGEATKMSNRDGHRHLRSRHGTRHRPGRTRVPESRAKQGWFIDESTGLQTRALQVCWSRKLCSQVCCCASPSQGLGGRAEELCWGAVAGFRDGWAQTSAADCFQFTKTQRNKKWKCMP